MARVVNGTVLELKERERGLMRKVFLGHQTKPKQKRSIDVLGDHPLRLHRSQTGEKSWLLCIAVWSCCLLFLFSVRKVSRTPAIATLTHVCSNYIYFSILASQPSSDCSVSSFWTCYSMFPCLFLTWIPNTAALILVVTRSPWTFQWVDAPCSQLGLGPASHECDRWRELLLPPDYCCYSQRIESGVASSLDESNDDGLWYTIL